ncbi:MAG: TolC family protein [Candidatus Zixiibacteriota bacterium]
MKVVLVAMVFIVGSCIGSALAQTGLSDSLTEERAVGLTLANHPAIRQAEYGLAASGAQIAVSRSARYPDISFDAGYVRIGPVPQFELPGQAPIELAPYNNYDLHIILEQTLYDFGRTDETIHAAETFRQTAADNVDLIKFSLAYQTINGFYNILILHQRIAVLEEQLQTLNQHFDISVKKMRAGTATDFDTLTVQVRIAVIQNDRIDALRMLETQEIVFRQLTALPSDAPINLSGAFASDKLGLNTDSLIKVASRQRPELALSRDAEASAEAKSQLVSLGNKPLLALQVASGFKNGYEPNLNRWQENYAAGLALKIPVFNGHKTARQRDEANAILNMARTHTIDLEQQIYSEVRQAIANANLSMEKIASTETQVHQAEKAVSMARARYAAGVITNLDLLDAETALSQTKLIRLRALYDYTVSLKELNRATGKILW